MIVPRTQLLYWIAAVALPFSLLGTLLPSALGVALLAIGLLSALAILDAALSHGLLGELEISLAPVIHLTQGRAGTIELIFNSGCKKPLALRLALLLPEPLQSGSESQALVLPAYERCTAQWPLTPMARGRYLLEACFAQCRSPLGLWHVRRRIPLTGEVRVFPNLYAERKNVAALFLPRGSVGIRRQRQLGKGREFEKLREYIHGDSLSDIHWKATARRCHPITKLFQVERTQEVYFIVDISRLCARTLTGTTGNSANTLERYLTSALIGCLAASRQGDLFGMIVFSDKVHSFIPANNGSAHYDVCRNALYALEPRMVSPDFNELFSTLRLRLRRRSLLIFLTSLDDPILAESFERAVQLVNGQHVLLVNMLAPPTARELFSCPQVSNLHDVYQHLAGHMILHDLKKLEKSLAQRGVHFTLLQHETMIAQLVNQYLDIKQRQVL